MYSYLLLEFSRIRLENCTLITNNFLKKVSEIFRVNFLQNHLASSPVNMLVNQSGLNS